MTRHILPPATDFLSRTAVFQTCPLPRYAMVRRRVSIRRLCIMVQSDADALGTDGKALGWPRGHDRQLCVVPHGLGFEALEHIGDVDRQSNLLRAALSASNILSHQPNTLTCRPPLMELHSHRQLDSSLDCWRRDSTRRWPAATCP